MFGDYLSFVCLICLCFTKYCSSEKNASIVYAVKNCIVPQNVSFLHGIIGHLFSDESDEKMDYYFSVCGFKTDENSSTSLNHSIISVSDDSVSEMGSFTNFSVFIKDDRYIVRFNDLDSVTDLILGCGGMAAFHLISHENTNSYVFDLFHPSLCSTRHSMKYTLSILLLCFSAFIFGYCTLSYLIKKCMYRKSWYQSIPCIDALEHINNRFKDYIVLHCHRPQTRLLEPVYMPVPTDSPDQFKIKKSELEIYDSLLEQKQMLLPHSDEQQDDVLLAL
uniref:SJCHGC06545 protein n=1 Tax=Schistosoma japonicum TaxID=6182 RepID=Q5DDI0_SCHJA|nr:SJCHGC06545 protein [Schistosoma japonicum]